MSSSTTDDDETKEEIPLTTGVGESTAESSDNNATPSKQKNKKTSRRFTFEMVQTALEKQHEKENLDHDTGLAEDSYKDVGMNRSLLRPSTSIRDPTRFGGGGGKSEHNDSNSSKLWTKPYWLGGGLFLALFAFWILDSLKDPILGALVNGKLQRHQPTAKLFSVCTNLLLVILLEYVSSEESKNKNKKSKNDDDDDILNGGGQWSQMNIEIGQAPVDDDNDGTKQDGGTVGGDRVSSSIFAYIGIPYCLFFLFVAFLLQYNPSISLMKSTSIDELSSTTSFEYQFTESTINSMSRDEKTAWHVVGYVIYAAIESFGSLIVATFWSYVNTTISLEEAMKYYGLIIALAQMGAIFGSTMVSIKIWDNLTLVVVSSLIIVLHVVTMISCSQRFASSSSSADASSKDTPEITNDANDVVDGNNTQASSAAEEEYSDEDEDEDDDDEDDDYIGDVNSPSLKQRPSDNNKRRKGNSSSNNNIKEEQHQHTLWSGLYLILKYNYVLLILGTSCLYEISLTCLNYQMTLLGYEKFEQEQHTKMTFTQFMGHYGQMVNICSLIMSSIIFPFLIKRLGLKYTIRLFPTLLLVVNIIAFGAFPGNLTVLFFSMSILKAMTYSIHDPTKEILYLPTIDPIKFKCKFWIDVMGARLAKAIGSSINTYAGNVVRSIRIASTPSLLTSIALWFVCYRVGIQFDYFVKNNIIVGSSTFNSNKQSYKYTAIKNNVSSNSYDSESDNEEHLHKDIPQKDDDPAVIELT